MTKLQRSRLCVLKIARVLAEKGTAMQRPWGRCALGVFLEHKEAKWGQRGDEVR